MLAPNSNRVVGRAPVGTSMCLLNMRESQARQSRVRRSLKDAQRLSGSPYALTVFSKVVEMPFDIRAEEDSRMQCGAAQELRARAGPSGPVPRLTDRAQPSARPAADRSLAALVEGAQDEAVSQYLFPPSAALQVQTVTRERPDSSGFAKLIDSRARPQTPVTEYRDKLLRMSLAPAQLQYVAVEDRLMASARASTGRSGVRAPSAEPVCTSPRPLSPSGRPPTASTGANRGVDSATNFRLGTTDSSPLRTSAVEGLRPASAPPTLSPTQLRKIGAPKHDVSYFMRMARHQVAAPKPHPALHDENSHAHVPSDAEVLATGGLASVRASSASAQRKLAQHSVTGRPPTAATVRARESVTELRVRLLRKTMSEGDSPGAHTGSTPSTGNLAEASSHDAARSRRGVVRARYNRL
jgi:hypothetical protein